MNLRGVLIPNKTVLAPMAGITDSPFRRICREFGAGLLFSEMISADALVRDRPETLFLARFTESERPIGIQLFGSDPEIMAGAAQRLESMQPDFIDINFGCPVKKVVNRGAGSALLRDLDSLAKIAEKTIQATSLPVLAKIRSGWAESETVAVPAARKLEGAGIAAITIHPRSRSMAFKGKANWQHIAEIKQSISIPVIGNGDIKSPADAKKIMIETGCDLIMIGRAALGNPWIFSQTLSILNGGVEPDPPTARDKIETCMRQFVMAVDWLGERKAIFEMRKHVSWYTKGLPGGSKLRNTIFRLNRLEDVKNCLIEFLKQTNDKVLV
jgi:tRNA-dihydrouridine synthase B